MIRRFNLASPLLLQLRQTRFKFTLLQTSHLNKCLSSFEFKPVNLTSPSSSSSGSKAKANLSASFLAFFVLIPTLELKEIPGKVEFEPIDNLRSEVIVAPDFLDVLLLLNFELEVDKYEDPTFELEAEVEWELDEFVARELEVIWIGTAGSVWI